MFPFVASFVAGLAGWTLLEYVIHYWLAHLPKGRILISSEHLKHHRDILHFTPLRLKIRGAIPVLALLVVRVGGSCGRSAYSRWAARRHLSHHFGLPNSNHGVTTPLWDLVFRTYAPVRRVRVPKGFHASVPWLDSAFDGRAEFQALLSDYELA